MSSLTGSPPPPSIQHTSHSSAAGRVYAIHELRQRILKLLTPKDLASFMRVESGCMEAVAAELYHTMSYEEVMKMGTATDRGRTYLAAVRLVDAKGLQPAPEQVQELGLEGKPADFQAASLERYKPILFDSLVTPLLSRCPALRWVEFGPGPKAVLPHDWWTMDFQHPTGGTLTMITTLSLTTRESPEYAFEIHVPPLPSPDYTVQTRFNLRIYVGHGKLHEGWSTMWAKEPRLGDLYHSVQFNDYPVSFDLLESVLEKQIAAGHSDRLRSIRGANLLPWTMQSFGSFARILFPSLTRISLQSPRNGNKLHSMGSTDLAGLVQAVRDFLPNLHHLELPIYIDRGVEVHCATLLTEDLLESDEEHMTFFNITRYLSQLVSSTGSLVFSLGTNPTLSLIRMPTVNESHTKFFRYLRNETRSRRIHLATVDFPALGYRTLHHGDLEAVRLLHYHQDGRPKTRIESEAAQRIKEAEALRDVLAQSSELASLTASVRALVQQSVQLSEISTGDSRPETLAKMRKLLESISKVESARDAAEEMLADLQKTTTDMGREILGAIKRLEAAQVGGE